MGDETLAAAFEDALTGGPPLLPLPPSDAEQRRVLDLARISQPVSEPDAVVVVATSGSTGRPKGVVLSRGAVAASVAATHDRLGGPGDWVLAVPAHYVAGLMVLARTILAGTAVHRIASDLSDLPIAVAQLTGRRYLSLVPTQLVRAYADPRLVEALATFDAVLLGGAAADPALLADARGRGIPIVTTYGMSETCGGCVYDGVPLDGVEVDVEADTGRILIGGLTLFSGYRRQPDLTAATLRNGRLLTQDRGVWRDQLLRVTGRMDDVVVSGGVNVDLAAVERAAQTWPGRDGSEIAVVGVPDDEWGTAVVAVTDGSGSEADLRAYLRRSLSPMAAPRRLAHLPVLPRTESGKIDRQRLIVELAQAETAGPTR